MAKNTLRVKDDNGEWIEVDLAAKPFPIQSDLDEKTISRISAVYSELKDVMNITLEQFEIDFMRNKRPDIEISFWETIVRCHRKVFETTENGEPIILNTQKNRTIAYKTIHHLILKAIPDQDAKSPFVLFVKKCFSEAYSDMVN